ncbi:hypothetical protein G6F40_015947 [Rhizopus arrhizus]|nr:hypothetical protein G6F40_015947 [Rhizopus arrhizus]
MPRGILVQTLDGHIHVQQQGALAVFPHQALHPEERAHARSARDGIHLVQARARVQHHVPCRQLYRPRPVGVVDDELAAVVGIGCREEQRGRQVSAHALGRAADAAHRVVHVIAEGLDAFIAVE